MEMAAGEEGVFVCISAFDCYLGAFLGGFYFLVLCCCEGMGDRGVRRMKGRSGMDGGFGKGELCLYRCLLYLK